MTHLRDDANVLPYLMLMTRAKVQVVRRQPEIDGRGTHTHLVDIAKYVHIHSMYENMCA